jgi:cytochrome P450
MRFMGKLDGVDLTDLDGVDLTDLDNFAAGFPHDIFAVHRAEAPVWWHEPTAHTPDGEGFWSVATYAEVLEVLNDPVGYSSERGGDRPYGGTLIQDLPVAGTVLNMMDDPRHNRIRRLVSTGLTARTVQRLEDELRRRAGALLDAVPDGEPIDLLVEVAAELPMQMICILLGVPTPTSASATAPTSAWAPTWPGSRSGCCTRRCSPGSATSRRPARSNGPAATATPASATSR